MSSAYCRLVQSLVFSKSFISLRRFSSLIVSLLSIVLTISSFDMMPCALSSAKSSSDVLTCQLSQTLPSPRLSSFFVMRSFATCARYHFGSWYCPSSICFHTGDPGGSIFVSSMTSSGTMTPLRSFGAAVILEGLALSVLLAGLYTWPFARS